MYQVIPIIKPFKKTDFILRATLLNADILVSDVTVPSEFLHPVYLFVYMLLFQIPLWKISSIHVISWNPGFSVSAVIWAQSHTENTDLTVQLICADAQPCSRGLRLSVGSSVSSQQIQSPQGVDVEVLLQLQSSLQHADGVRRLLFQLEVGNTFGIRGKYKFQENLQDNFSKKKNKNALNVC